VLDITLKAISNEEHIRPIIYTDKELEYLDESYCDGIRTFRKELYKTIQTNTTGVKIQTLLHNEVFAKLDAASKLFSVLVLKTETTLPYTSIFIEFDCKYWSEAQENELRKRMNKKLRHRLFNYLCLDCHSKIHYFVFNVFTTISSIIL